MAQCPSAPLARAAAVALRKLELPQRSPASSRAQKVDDSARGEEDIVRVINSLYLTVSQIIATGVRRRRRKGRVSGRVVRRHAALTILGGERPRRSTHPHLSVERVFVAIRSAHSSLASGVDSSVLTALLPAGGPDSTRWAAPHVRGHEGDTEQQAAEGHPHSDREQHSSLDLVATRVGLLGRRLEDLTCRR